MQDPALHALADRAPISRTEIHECSAEAFDGVARRIDAGLDWGVGAVVTDPQDRVLLIHEHDRWQTPGGEVESGESHEEALRREVAEETGITVDPGDLLAVTENRYRHDGDERAFAFAHYTADLVGNGTVSTDPGLYDEDIQAVEWRAELPENTLQADIIRAGLE